MSAQFEAAAALIAAGATRPARDWTPAILGAGPRRTLPEASRSLALCSLDPSECHRVSSLALADGCVQVAF